MSGHSEKGWTTADTFYNYLLFLRQHFNDDDDIHLILDSYKAHKCQSVQDLAQTLHIKLYYIPSGLTDMFQPLDKRIFSCLKATAKYLFKKAYNDNPNQKFSKSIACQYMIWAWEHLHSHVILEAWSLCYSYN